MRGYTHLVVSALAGYVVGQEVGCATGAAITAAVAGLLPDIDEPRSVIGRRLPVTSRVLNFTVGHRSITHTIWFALLIGGVCTAIPKLGIGMLSGPSSIYGLAGLVGCLAHLVLDASTITGVKPLYPLTSKTFRGNFRTGGLVDTVVLVLSVIAMLKIIKMI